jgi:hypothetical protein
MSIWDRLSLEQKQKALEYDGPEAFGNRHWRVNPKLQKLIADLRNASENDRPATLLNAAADALEELQIEIRCLSIQMDDMADLLEHYIDRDETIKWKETKDEH